MCSEEKFGAVSSERRADAIPALISNDPTRHFSPNNRLIRTQFCKWSRPLLTESGSQAEFDVTHSKQSIRKFLAEARTHISISQFCAKFTPKLGAWHKKDSASRDASEQGKIPLNAQKEKEPQ
jgi:hypothetical protein